MGETKSRLRGVDYGAAAAAQAFGQNKLLTVPEYERQMYRDSSTEAVPGLKRRKCWGVTLRRAELDRLENSAK